MSEQLFIFLQKIIPQHCLSRWLGRVADCEVNWLKNALIRLFIWHFNVDMTLARQSDYRKFASFNAFFTRELRNDARVIANDWDSIACPADGLVSEMGTIERDFLLQAKNAYYSTSDLLGGDPKLAASFTDGQFATIYLSPRDYHRVHMPIDGTLTRTIYIPGDLFSVNQATADNVSSLFARNERLVCLFETDCGPVAVILVGAMIVASIETTWGGRCDTHSDDVVMQTFDGTRSLGKGEELGRFQLGSTVILLFGKEAIHWQKGLAKGVAVRMGQKLGTLL